MVFLLGIDSERDERSKYCNGRSKSAHREGDRLQPIAKITAHVLLNQCAGKLTSGASRLGSAVWSSSCWAAHFMDERQNGLLPHRKGCFAAGGFSFAIAALPLESALVALVRRLGVGPPEILAPMRHRWDGTVAER
jgi:hypothetical protein